MPNFARRLMAAYRGNPEETVELWDDLDFAESERTDYYPPSENLTGGESRMLGWCGRHTLPTDPDQELDPDPWEDYRDERTRLRP